MSEKTAKLLSTFFYIGEIPVAPGSMASLVCVFLHILLNQLPIVYVLIFIAVTIIGFQSSGITEKALKQKDPSCIVIDEVSGGMIAFFMLPVNVPVLVTAYFLFRAFDMFKIYPVDRFEEMEGAKGIMMDDIIAGIYTNIIMHLALRFAHLA